MLHTGCLGFSWDRAISEPPPRHSTGMLVTRAAWKEGTRALLLRVPPLGLTAPVPRLSPGSCSTELLSLQHKKK